jgi:hypothetical protein
VKFNIILKTVFLFAGLLTFSFLAAQETDVYSLLTERFVDRPINVHRGQLQINSGYNFSIINKKFDADGKSIDLTEDGSPAVKQLIPLDIRFGILEHLQFSAKINYARTGIRERNIGIATEDQISIDHLDEYKGLDDLYIGLDIRAPLGLKWIDWTVSGGLFLPVADHKPEKPSHRILTLAYETEYTQINYHYINKYSSGVPGASLGSSFQFCISNFSVLIGGNFMTGLKEGKSIFWNSRLVDGAFEYESQEYQYYPGQQISYHALLAYQAIDWFVILGSFSGLQTSNGWSNQSQKKIGYPEESFVGAGLGYEIIVSPNLRITQMIELPVAGKNHLGFLVINTGVSLNFISQSYHSLF